MHTGRTCLWSKITREIQALASLASLFTLALLLAWLLSVGRVFSFFQSPTSPLPPTEAPLPTEMPTPTEAVPALTPTAPPIEMVTEATLSPTKMVMMPAVQAARPTALPTELPPSKGAISLWPWVLLGFLSVGAIAAGVFLLRREAPSEEGGG